MTVLDRHAVALLIVAAALGGACARTRPGVMTGGGDGGMMVTTADGAVAADRPTGADLRAEAAAERPPRIDPETCGNGLDDDGDGQVDEGCSCRPGERQDCFPAATRLAGIGTCAAGTQMCGGQAEFGGWQACTGAVTPAPELCDGLDNDCDGVVDNGCACTPGTSRACYTGPGPTRLVGLCRDGAQVCASGPGGAGSDWGPCTGGVRPVAEVCDGEDNDCNGTIDDGCTCTPGATRDCYGGPAGTAGKALCHAGTQRCEAVAGGSAWGACTGQVLPGVELCDGADNDCDGTADDGCNCAAGATRACYSGPAATRLVGACRDGTQTCVAGAGGVGTDWGPCTGGALPGAETCNEVDDDCDGVIDDGCACRRGQTRACYDGPAATAGVGICRNGSQGCIIEAGNARWAACAGAVLPAAAGEVCNNLDDDCNGKVDDGLARACGSTVGDCRAGTETCAAGTWGACLGGTGPAVEDCNGGDDDCDGMIDEGCACFDGSTAPCGGPAVGVCKLGTKTCVRGQYGACVGAVGPATEICNNVDDDCDGMIDEGCLCSPGQTRSCYDGPSGTAGVAACRAGTQTCAAVSGDSMWGACTGQLLPTMETCNGLDDDCNGAADDGIQTAEQVFTPRVQKRNADLLFMIDNSSSMTATQANLIANFPVLMQTLRGFAGGLPDLHIAVVTSNLGAGTEVGLAQCAPGGDGGVFRAPAPTATCQGPHGAYIDESNGEAVKNYDGTIEQAFSCIANVGVTGCGFEHQLASAAVALGFRGAIPAANQGFLRPDAFLAVVFITNEDDCSAPPDSPIFSATSLSLSDPYGPLTSYRCNEFGHLCAGARPPRVPPPMTPVTLSDCHSAEDGVLYKVSELAGFFQSLKPDPSMVFVSAITAPAVPYGVHWINNAQRPGEQMPEVDHACTRSTDGSYADPSVRLTEFVGKFGANGSVSSICDDSFAPALTRLGNTLGKALAPQCLTTAIPDHDSTHPGIQATCQVVAHVPDASGQVADQPLAACTTASASSGPAPCWYLTSNAACSSATELIVNRAAPPEPGETVSVRCNPCR